MPVEYIDERLSSAEASRAMTAAGADRASKRGSVDMVAASLFLQKLPRTRTEPAQPRGERMTDEAAGRRQPIARGPARAAGGAGARGGGDGRRS